MSRYHFPGFPAYLDAAAAEIERPEAAGPARRDPILAAMSNLCAQAAEADPRHVAGILAKAQEMSDQLRVAHRASELMLADLRAGRAVSDEISLPRRTRSASPPSDTRGASRKHG